MLRSMTAFAREQADTRWGYCVWELRSVNHRYLDVYVRLPEELRGLEPAVRERVGRRLSRGKLECLLRLKPEAGSHTQFTFNSDLARQIIEAAQTLKNMLPDSAPLQALDILRWPGVLHPPDPDPDTMGETLLASLDRALEQLVAHREREGQQIHALLTQRCQGVEQEVARVDEVLPEVLEAQRERLRARLTEISAELNHDRLEQEMVLLTQKLDVAEELDRLRAHLTEIRQTLESSRAVGRRLDFLVQELHREANTLGAKSAHTATTQSSVNLKVLIEQMREQIQNVE